MPSKLSNKSELVVSNLEVDQTGAKQAKKDEQTPSQSLHLLHTTAAISQINANSPSFKPSIQTQGGQVNEEAKNSITESASHNPIPLDK